MARLPAIRLPARLHLTGRRRTAAVVAGYSLLSLVAFLVTLKYSFPYQRIEGKLREALGSKYDVAVGSVTHGFWPGQIELHKVILHSRPTRPDEKPAEIIIDRLVVDLGLDFGVVAAIRHKASLDIEADVGGGRIEGTIEASKQLVAVHLETDGLPLGGLPGVTEAVGLPMSGGLDADIDLSLPGGKWKNADGSIEISCNGCTVGDGVARLKPPAPVGHRRISAAAAAWRAEGVTVPRLNLGKARIEIAIAKGLGTIKTFSAASPDGWLKLDGKIQFRDPVGQSLMPGCMHFKLSDELKKRDPKFGNIEYTLPEKSRQEDGSFALPTKGRLTAMGWDVRHKCSGGSTLDDGDGGALSGLSPGRPSLAPSLPSPLPGKVEPAEVPGVAGEGSNGKPEETPGPGTSGPPLSGMMPSGQADRDGGPGVARPDNERPGAGSPAAIKERMRPGRGRADDEDQPDQSAPPDERGPPDERDPEDRPAPAEGEDQDQGEAPLD